MQSRLYLDNHKYLTTCKRRVTFYKDDKGGKFKEIRYRKTRNIYELANLPMELQQLITKYLTMNEFINFHTCTMTLGNIQCVSGMILIQNKNSILTRLSRFEQSLPASFVQRLLCNNFEFRAGKIQCNFTEDDNLARFLNRCKLITDFQIWNKIIILTLQFSTNSKHPTIQKSQLANLLENIPNLQSFSLCQPPNIWIDRESRHNITLKKLTTLCLVGKIINNFDRDSGLAFSCPLIMELHLKSCLNAHFILTHFTHSARQILTLNLSLCTNLRDVPLKLFLQNTVILEELNIGYCEQLTSNVLEGVCQCRKMKVLDISEMKINCLQGILQTLQSCTMLHSYTLSVNKTQLESVQNKYPNVRFMNIK